MNGRQKSKETGRDFYQLEDDPAFQEQVEKLRNSDPVRAQGSFFEGLILRILNNIKAAYKKAEAMASNIGQPGGSASLDEKGKVPAEQLSLGLPGGLASLDDDGKIPVAQIPVLGYDPKGAAETEAAKIQTNLVAHAGDAAKHIAAAERAAWNGKADSSALAAHAGDKANPHGVTAAQTGALPLAGGTITGALKVAGKVDVSGSAVNVDGSILGGSFKLSPQSSASARAAYTGDERSEITLQLLANQYADTIVTPYRHGLAPVIPDARTVLVRGIATPRADYDAANRKYVDAGVNTAKSAASAAQTAANNALPKSGGTMTGNLRLKNSGNYGMKINLGDSDYVYLYEQTDDFLEIKGSKGIAMVGAVANTVPTSLKINEVKFVYS